jgi:hypothetical protein
VGASRHRLGLPPPVYGAGAAAMAAVQAVAVASWGADMARHGRGRRAPRECGCVRRKKKKKVGWRGESRCVVCELVCNRDARRVA